MDHFFASVASLAVLATITFPSITKFPYYTFAYLTSLKILIKTAQPLNQ